MADQFTLPETLKGIVKTGKGMSLQYPTNVKMWIEIFIVLKLCIINCRDAHRKHLFSFGSLILLKMLTKDSLYCEYKQNQVGVPMLTYSE